MPLMATKASLSTPQSPYKAGLPSFPIPDTSEAVKARLRAYNAIITPTAILFLGFLAPSRHARPNLCNFSLIEILRHNYLIQMLLQILKFQAKNSNKKI